MRKLSEILKIYEAKKEIVDVNGFSTIKEETGIKEVNDEIIEKLKSKIEEIKEKSTVKEVKELEDVKAGDVIEIIPSVDGNNLYLLVIGTDEELNFIRTILLSEFVEFCTPNDVIVEVKNFELKGNSQRFIAETDLFVDIPFKYVIKEKGLKIFKVGHVDKEDLDKVIDVHFGDRKGDNPYLTPTKRKFKELETERLGKLFSYILS
jgi:hypothetical protein